MKLVPNSNFSGSQNNHFLFSLLLELFLHCSLPHRASSSDYHLLFQLSFLETSAFTYIFLQGDVNEWANEVLKQLFGIILFCHRVWACTVGRWTGKFEWRELVKSSCLLSTIQLLVQKTWLLQGKVFCILSQLKPSWFLPLVLLGKSPTLS